MTSQAGYCSEWRVIVHHNIIVMHCTFIQFEKIAVQIVVIGLKSDQNCVKGLMAET